MIKANELRSGVSKLHYLSSEGDLLICTIDWQDIRWCEDDNKGFNLAHTPIPLTEEILLKCEGHELIAEGIIEYNRFTLTYLQAYKYWYVTTTERYVTKVEYLHEWQNVVFALNNNELQLSHL